MGSDDTDVDTDVDTMIKMGNRLRHALKCPCIGCAQFCKHVRSRFDNEQLNDAMRCMDHPQLIVRAIVEEWSFPELQAAMKSDVSGKERPMVRIDKLGNLTAYQRQYVDMTPDPVPVGGQEHSAMFIHGINAFVVGSSVWVWLTQPDLHPWQWTILALGTTLMILFRVMMALTARLMVWILQTYIESWDDDRNLTNSQLKSFQDVISACLHRIVKPRKALKWYWTSTDLIFAASLMGRYWYVSAFMVIACRAFSLYMRRHEHNSVLGFIGRSTKGELDYLRSFQS